MERSFIADLSWRGRRTLGFVHLTTGDARRFNPANAKLIAAIHPSKREKGDRASRSATRRRPSASSVLWRRPVRDWARTALEAWLLMIATAARPFEALKARWQEVNLDKKLWTLPAARTKSSREHVAPLNSIALAVLERQARVRSGDAVFGGRSELPLRYNAFATAPMKIGI